METTRAKRNHVLYVCGQGIRLAHVVCRGGGAAWTGWPPRGTPRAVRLRQAEG